MRTGGSYRVDFTNPATEFVDCDSWGGEGYRINVPYAVTENIEGQNEEARPGSWSHSTAYLGGFAIVASKGQ